MSYRIGTIGFGNIGTQWAEAIIATPQGTVTVA